MLDIIGMFSWYWIPDTIAQQLRELSFAPQAASVRSMHGFKVAINYRQTVSKFYVLCEAE